jgi:hypothetical protein
MHISHRRSALLVAAVIVSALATLAAACADEESSSDDTGSTTSTTTDASDTTTTAGDRTYRSDVYADPAHWLCRPDVEGDACDIDLDATLVDADGTQTVEPFEAQTDAPVDCFYVYPTISTDPGDNSDLVPDDAERNIAANQAARFGEVCNVYAPAYRQVPLGALFDRVRSGGVTTTTVAGGPPQPWEIAYADVLDAFRHYLANDNDGRPFELIGHSQGAGHLRALISEEIDGDEQLRDQMLSAMLIGTSVEVSGEDGFENVGACQDAADTGCVVSYASFAAGEPPPADSLFGKPRTGEGTALCSNPAALDDDSSAPLSSYYLAGHAPDAPQVGTPWIHYRGLVTGGCSTDGTFNWLEITNTSEEGDALPDDLGGRLTPEWGLHLMDVNLAQGDLIELVRTQSGQG